MFGGLAAARVAGRGDGAVRYVGMVLAVVAVAASAGAELQNVEVGGQIRIRMRSFQNVFDEATRAPAAIRIPVSFLQGRALGPYAAESRMSWDARGNDRNYVEQATRLRVTADFTGGVKGVVELDDYEQWGDGDFRSDYLTGADARAATTDDVEVLQSYVDVGEVLGTRLGIRVGRQQLQFEDGWLVAETQGLIEQSFDAVRLTWAGDQYVLDGWMAKLAESGVAEQDGDVDFCGLHATCTAVEQQTFAAYWYWVRDGRSVNDTNYAWAEEWLEGALGLDDYGVTNLHTFGAHADGRLGAFDYRADVAWQTGSADQVGALFAAYTYGDDDASYDTWGGDVEMGYRFDAAWKPRVYAGGAYYGGEDHRDASVVDWLGVAFRPEASVSFNRLFSGRTYYWTFDQDRNISNFHEVRVGASVKPSESVTVTSVVSRLWANAGFDWPVYARVGRYRLPLAPALTFLTEETDKDLGTVVQVQVAYAYSEALSFRLVGEYLFTDEGLTRGNYLYYNGLEFSGGSASDDATYFCLDTRLRF